MFRSFGITGERSIFAHCIHINEREREIIRETNTAVAHNPEPNVGNALRRHFQKHPNIGRAELPAMLIDNKAEIAGRAFPVKLGRFKEGYAADAALTDYLPPTELSAGTSTGISCSERPGTVQRRQQWGQGPHERQKTHIARP